MKEIKQNKENKEKFYSRLIEPLLIETQDKKDLMDQYGFSERGARYEIQMISMFYPVISNSKNKGYRIVDVEKAINENSQQQEIFEINVTLSELQSRIKMLKKRMKPLIATKKVLERSLQENENK